MLLDDALQAGTDIKLPIIVRQTNKKGVVLPASGFAEAQFSILTMSSTGVISKDLISGITVEDIDTDSVFIVSLSVADTLEMEGLYQVLLVVTDIEGTTSIPVHNELTFKPRI